MIYEPIWHRKRNIIVAAQHWRGRYFGGGFPLTSTLVLPPAHYDYGSVAETGKLRHWMSYHQIARAFADSLFQRRHGFGLPGRVDVARTTAREPPVEHPWGQVNDLVPNRAASV